MAAGGGSSLKDEEQVGAVRCGLSADTAGFGALAAAAGYRGWTAVAAEQQLSAGGALFCAQHNNRPPGFLLLSKLMDEAELLLVVVPPKARRQGLGTRLLREAISWLRRARVRSFFLEVERGAPAAQLYANVGFVACGARPGYYGPGRDALLMRLDLTPAAG